MRACILTSFLFMGVLIFHHIGGGEIRFTPLVIPVLLSSIIYFRFKPIEIFDGPSLALAIVLFQALGHFTITSGAHQNNASMGISHIIASVLTYQFAKHFDAATDACDRLLAYLYPKAPILFLISIFFGNLREFPRFKIELSNFLRDGLKERAPPVSYCA